MNTDKTIDHADFIAHIFDMNEDEQYDFERAQERWRNAGLRFPTITKKSLDDLGRAMDDPSFTPWEKP